MLDARRYRAAAAHLGELLAREHGRALSRRAAAGRACAARSCQPADGSQDPQAAGRGDRPAAADAAGDQRAPHRRAAGHASPSASPTCAACCGAGAFSFDEAVRGADRMTVAVTLFALLELYKRGEADWEQQESFGEIAVRARSAAASAHRRGARRRGGRVSDPADVLDAVRRTPRRMLDERLAGRARRGGARAQARTRPRSRARSRRCCSCPPIRSAPRSWPRPREAGEDGRAGGARAARRAVRARPARDQAARARRRLDARERPRRPRTPPAACSAARAPPRSRPPRPRRSRSSPTCSRSRARRSPASAVSAPTRPPPRCSTAA